MKAALTLFFAATLVSAANVQASLITATFPTSRAKPVNLDAAAGGFLKIGSNLSNPDQQVNTTGGIVGPITHVGSFTSTTEYGNSANYYQFVSVSHGINDNQGANTGYGPDVDNTGNGFTFSVANSTTPLTLNVYVGEYNANSTLTVATTNAGTATNSQSSGSNLYLDYVVALPANSGPTTISWVESASNGGFNNPSIFAVTATPEPSSFLLCGLGRPRGLHRRPSPPQGLIAR